MPPSPTARTTHISATQFQRLYQSTALANCDGLVLNKFVTVSWEVAGPMDAATNLACHNKLVETMRTWFYDKAKLRGEMPSFACIWVREQGKKFGLHSHFLLHVDRDLEGLFRQWLNRAVPRIARKAVGQLPDEDQGILLHQGPNGGNCTNNQWSIFRYLLKGLDPDALFSTTTDRHAKHLIAEFGRIKTSYEGEIWGPRCGSSRQLGPSMQKEFVRLFQPPPLWPSDLPFGEFLPYDRRYRDWYDFKMSEPQYRAITDGI